MKPTQKSQPSPKPDAAKELPDAAKELEELVRRANGQGFFLD